MIPDCQKNWKSAQKKIVEVFDNIHGHQQLVTVEKNDAAWQADEHIVYQVPGSKNDRFDSENPRDEVFFLKKGGKYWKIEIKLPVAYG